MVPTYPDSAPASLCRQWAYRAAIPAGLLGVFATLALLWTSESQPVYFAALRFLGIGPYKFPFLDIHAVLAAAQCSRQGIDVYLSNPCDVLGRLHSYSPLWLTLVPSSWGTLETPWVGLSLDLLLILSLPIVLDPRSAGEAAIFAVAAFSPTTALALERANNDLIIFLLVLCGALLYVAPRRYRLGAYAFFLIAGLLKYYPLVLLVLMARKRWRNVLLPATIVLVTLILFALYYRAEIGVALADIPAGYYFTNVFSARNLPLGLAASISELSFPARTAVAICVLFAILAAAFARIQRTFPVLATIESDRCEREAPWLAIGSLLITACFFTGSNAIYRGIFLLLVLSGLVRLLRAADNATTRQFLWSMITAVLLVLWEEFFRRTLYGAFDGVPNEWLRVRGKFFFWAGRELVWWWLIAGLASIATLHLWRMPLTKESIVMLGRRHPKRSTQL